MNTGMSGTCWCGKKIPPYKKGTHGPKKKYCSLECGVKMSTKLRRERYGLINTDISGTCYCGKKIPPYKKGTHGPKKKYCSLECGVKYRYLKPDIKCLCGNVFSVGALGPGAKSRKKWCSDECREEHYKKEREKQAPPIQNCKSCGQFFRPSKHGHKKWRLGKKKLKCGVALTDYCNKKECQKECRRVISAKRNKPLPIKKIKCKRCGKKFETNRGCGGGIKFCSRTCGIQGERERRKLKLKKKQEDSKITKHCIACGTPFKTNRIADGIGGKTICGKTKCSRIRFELYKKSNPSYAIACRLRSRIRTTIRTAVKKAAFKKNNIANTNFLPSAIFQGLISDHKKKTTEELTGCSFKELVSHIEAQFTKGMSWDVFLCKGRKGIHIDHIMPCDSFDLTKESEQKKCFHYTNLQPLWAFDNLSKGAKIAA